MADKLPPLTFNPQTRVGLEALIYYNFGRALLLGKLMKTAGGSIWLPEASCAGAGTAPPGGFQAARAATALGAAVALGGSVGPPVVPGKSFPDYPPIGAAIELGTAFTEPAEGEAPTYGFTGNNGDTVEIWSLPDPAGDKLICYDRGFNAQEGVTRRAVPRKFNAADHYVPQRGENTISLSDLMVTNYEGVSALKGRDITLIVRWMANGAVPVEIDYFTNVQLTTVPALVPADDNDNATIDAEGSFGAQLRFAAGRPVVP